MVAELARIELFFLPEVIQENQSDNFGYFWMGKEHFCNL
jgi:hypothetical protein